MKRILLGVVGAFAALLVIAQFLPVARSNPPVVADVGAPEPVNATLRASCYDCHSNETRWPWYSGIAPASWFLANHVIEGREHLNFSEWGNYSPQKQQKLLEEAHEEVREGKMPMTSYLLLHPDARLVESGKQALLDWVTSVSPSAANPRSEGTERDKQDDED